MTIVAWQGQGKKYSEAADNSDWKVGIRALCALHRSYCNLERWRDWMPYARSFIVHFERGQPFAVSRAGLARLKEFLGEKALTRGKAFYSLRLRLFGLLRAYSVVSRASRSVGPAFLFTICRELSKARRLGIIAIDEDAAAT